MTILKNKNKFVYALLMKKKIFLRCAQTLNIVFAINSVNKSNLLMEVK